MHRYAVGDLYHVGRTSWPEVVQYNFRGGHHELVLFWRSPSDQDVEGIRKGETQFALLYEEGVVWFLYRIAGACNWSDAPFSWHLLSPEERQFPPELPTPDSRATLFICLVDADTGIIRAMRNVSFSPKFSRSLHSAISAQAKVPYDAAAHDAAIARAYAKHPDSESMRRAAPIWTRGGDEPNPLQS